MNSQSERTIIDNTNHLDLLGPEIFNSAKMSERNNDINLNLNIEMMLNNNNNKQEINKQNIIKNTEENEENEETNRIENPVADIEQNFNI
jgi:hypothetical protein